MLGGWGEGLEAGMKPLGGEVQGGGQRPRRQGPHVVMWGCVCVCACVHAHVHCREVMGCPGCPEDPGRSSQIQGRLRGRGLGAVC